MKRIFLFIALLMSVLRVDAQSAWTREKGMWFAQAGVQATTPAQRLTAAYFKTRYLHRKVMDVSIPLYFEYGIIDRLTVYAQLPTRLVSSGRRVMETPSDAKLLPPADTLPSGVLVGLGNSELGFRIKLLDKGAVLSMNLNAAAPATGLQRSTQLLTGYPCWAFTASLHAGVSGAKWYLQGGGGFVYRTHQYNPQWLANIEMGYKVKKVAYLSWSLLAKFTIGTGRVIPYDHFASGIQTGLFINHQNYFVWMLKCYVPFGEKSPWGISAFLAGGFLVSNIHQAPSLGVSVFYKRIRKEVELKN